MHRPVEGGAAVRLRRIRVDALRQKRAHGGSVGPLYGVDQPRVSRERGRVAHQQQERPGKAEQLYSCHG